MACCCGAGGGTEAVGGGAEGEAAQEASARAARVGNRKPAGCIVRGREWAAFVGAILYEPAPPPHPGQPAAGVGQIGGPGAGPGPGLGAMGRTGGAAGRQLEQAQGPAAGTIGQQLGGQGLSSQPGHGDEQQHWISRRRRGSRFQGINRQ